MRNKLFLTAAFAAVASVSQAVLVLNQVPAVQTEMDSLFASQDFEVGLNAFDCITIEDFTVTSSQTLVTQVRAMMGGFGGFTSPAQWANVTGFHLNFYTSVAAGASNLTGNAGSLLVSVGSAVITDPGFTTFNGTVRLVTLNVNMVLPGAGTYWVGVNGIMDATGSSNQIGVGNNNVTSGGNNSALVNPGGGFGEPNNTHQWFDDSAYSVNATAVPEPGSMIALGLGVTALLARRRRKVA